MQVDTTARRTDSTIRYLPSFTVIPLESTNDGTVVLATDGEASAERPQSGQGELGPGVPQAQPPIRPLNRVDSRSTFPQQVLRPGAIQPSQQRPQFQPGGPVTTPQQFVQRPGTPQPRPSGPLGAPGTQPARPPPLRPFGPQSVVPQQGPRPQSPNLTQAPQRALPPNNLQFGPRQPPTAGATTPDAAKPQIYQQPNNSVKITAPGQPAKQPSQFLLKGSDSAYQNKPVNLDTQIEKNFIKSENSMEMAGMAKGRSYSIAAAPGTLDPLKSEDDRRKSVSAIGSIVGDEFVSRSPGLGLIQEGKLGSSDNIRESKESVRSEASNEGRDILNPERPESRLPGSKMAESFMGSQSNLAPRKKTDDDDVVSQNNVGVTHVNDTLKNQIKTDLNDRSPSLTRSDDSPEQKNVTQNPSAPINRKPQTVTPEPQRPKTPKTPEKIRDMRPLTPLTKTLVKSPVQEIRHAPVTPRKPSELDTSVNYADAKNLTPKKINSAPKSRPKDGDNDSGVDESTQGNDVNGSPRSPNKKIPTKLPTKEKSNGSFKPNLSRSSSKSATPKTPENLPPSEKKKVPMNKVQVGNAPSPNIKAVKSKIGSLENATYRPGGGKIKIENRKLEFGNVTSKIAAKNDAYAPSGGAKKITTTKLEWNVKSKVGSLQNSAYKPGGGDKKIETVKLDFKEKAKPKVASTANLNHKPGGGAVKIEKQKLEFKAQSKVGSLDNVKHKPGGGDIKIFDDKDYIKQIGHSPVSDSQGHSRQESPLPPSTQPPTSDDHYYMSVHQWSEEDRPKSRCLSARAPRTPRTLSPRRKYHAVDEEEDELVSRNNEKNRRKSMARPASARDPPGSACSRRRASLTQRPAFSIY